jgi:thiol-disulfide isomerase/thioredoxin
MKRGPALAAIAVIVAIVIALAIYWTHRPPEQPSNVTRVPMIGTAQVGNPAPEFSVPTTSGPFDLQKQTRPVLLEVFASWCPHCQRETVVLNRLYRSFKTRVSFVAIPGSTTAMDGVSPESEADIFGFIQRFSVLYPVAIYDPSLTVSSQYIQGGFPTLAVIGKDKKILYLGSGEIAYDVLADQLNIALAAR